MHSTSEASPEDLPPPDEPPLQEVETPNSECPLCHQHRPRLNSAEELEIQVGRIENVVLPRFYEAIETLFNSLPEEETGRHRSASISGNPVCFLCLKEIDQAYTIESLQSQADHLAGEVLDDLKARIEDLREDSLRPNSLSEGNFEEELKRAPNIGDIPQDKSFKETVTAPIKGRISRWSRRRQQRRTSHHIERQLSSWQVQAIAKPRRKSCFFTVTKEERVTGHSAATIRFFKQYPKVVRLIGTTEGLTSKEVKSMGHKSTKRVNNF